MKRHIEFTLNSKPIAAEVRPDTTVLDIIRNHLNLKGTKEGCAEGDCGACTVLIARDGINGGRPMAANSCIMTAGQIVGAHLTTVEGIGGPENLSELQAAMAENGSSQCGFCTPGIVVALSGLLHNNPSPSEPEIHDALAGNLCRCTGYKPIVQAVQKMVAPTQKHQPSTTVPDAEYIEVGQCRLHRPQNLEQLLKIRGENPDAVLLAGGTDIGVARAGYETDWDNIIVTSGVDALRTISTDDDAWHFGAAVTWSEVLDTVEDELPSFATLIRRFGSTQIRSMGTIGGNIGTASPIGDGPPAMIALGAEIVVADAKEALTTLKLEDFFLDYRKTALPKNGVIVSVRLPRPKPGEEFRVYKVSKRYDQDISTVCGAFWLKMAEEKIEDIRIAYGGMAATPKRALKAEQAMRNQILNDQTIASGMAAIETDFSPLNDWRGSEEYRTRVAASLLKRLQAELAGEPVEVVSL